MPLLVAMFLVLFGGMFQASAEQDIATLRNAAEHGDAMAQYRVGLSYAMGNGVPQDDRQAIPWYKKAADQDNASSQVSLGLMYAEGRGVPQDDEQAAIWYKKSAEQGDMKAQYNLAFMYRNGRGVPQDDVNAYIWYSLAAAQGQVNAANGRDLAASQFSPEQRSKAQAQAVEFQSKINKQKK